MATKLWLTHAELTMDASYPKDPDPKNWRTIEGAHVHLKNGKIDGGAGGKFSGHWWTGKEKHEFIGPKIPAIMPGAETSGWKTAAVPKTKSTGASKKGPVPKTTAPKLKSKTPAPAKTEGTGTVDFGAMEKSYYDYRKATDKDTKRKLYKSFVNNFYKKADDATIAKFYEKHPPLTMKHLDQTLEKGRKAVFTSSDPPSKAQKKKIQKITKDYLEKGAFAMKIKSEYMDNVIKDWFKNQFETHTSGGAFSPTSRAKASCSMFSIGDMKGYEREKYGYLASPEVSNSSGPSWYGSDCTIRFKKDRLKGRITYTLRDSLNAGAAYGGIYPGDAFNPNIDPTSLSGFDQDMTKEEAKKFIQKAGTLHVPPDSPSEASNEYIELQYHGPLTIADVESVVLSEVHKVSHENIEKMKKLGIKVYESHFGKFKEL